MQIVAAQENVIILGVVIGAVHSTPRYDSIIFCRTPPSPNLTEIRKYYNKISCQKSTYTHTYTFKLNSRGKKIIEETIWSDLQL